MPVPESPDGYTDYKQYDLPRWGVWIVSGVLVILSLMVIHLQEVALFPGVVEVIVASGFGIAGGLFLHESLHYVAAQKLGHDPVYCWPNTVYVPDESLNKFKISSMLLAPQLLTILYVPLLLTGLPTILETVIGWALILNLGGGAKDVIWTIRRIAWPDGTQVIVTEEQRTYVAHPEDSA